jgi:hypothetical protein
MSNLFIAMSGKENLLDSQGLEANRNGEITRQTPGQISFDKYVFNPYGGHYGIFFSRLELPHPGLEDGLRR